MIKKQGNSDKYVGVHFSVIITLVMVYLLLSSLSIEISSNELEF